MMTETSDTGNPVQELAEDHFKHLARAFPVMCSSDEFHFLPRAEASSFFPDRLEDLSPEAVAEACSSVRSLAGKVSMQPEPADLETIIDRELLLASCRAVLIELENQASWRRNPLLYLSIACIGLDRAFNAAVSEPEERIECARSRLSQAGRLLKQACANLDRIPQSHFSAAQSMLQDCRAYLRELASQTEHRGSNRFLQDIETFDRQLIGFGSFLHGTAPEPDRSFNSAGLEQTLREHFRSSRSLTDIRRLADEERLQSLKELNRLQRQLDPSRSWTEIHQTLLPGEEPIEASWRVYRREFESIQRFFTGTVFQVDASEAPLRLASTPTCLRSLRSSASFASALLTGQPSYFFLEPENPATGPSGQPPGEVRRIDRDHPFLTAHETIPGHHCLDANRRRLVNPVRRQIESPLFYEGWATYAESLLEEHGYLEGPMNRLVQEKRRLWRAVRCLIDLGGCSGEPDRSQSARLLVEAGFSKQAALGQVDRYRLKPGYQLCYTLGDFELRQLKNRFEPALGSDGFHRAVLQGGQIPFHLLEKRLASLAG